MLHLDSSSACLTEGKGIRIVLIDVHQSQTTSLYVNGQVGVLAKAVKTVRDLIYWQYAKIIGESAGFGKKQFAFVMDQFKKLESGEIEWSTAIREYIKEREKPNECLYCGSKQNISTDHLVPRNKGGPDTADNAVTACKKCNSSKGEKGIYEWFQLDRRYEVPRIAEGKHLKLLYQLHKEKGTLDKKRRGPR